MRRHLSNLRRHLSNLRRHLSNRLRHYFNVPTQISSVIKSIMYDLSMSVIHTCKLYLFFYALLKRSMKVHQLLIKTKMLKNQTFWGFQTYIVLILLINVKMLTTLGI